MKIILAAILGFLTVPSFAEIDGKFTPSTPAIGAWQSLTSADEALGIKEDLMTINFDAQPLLVVGIQASITKSALPGSSNPVRFVGGPTALVPGSLLDWTLGTSWGKQWLPKAKAGLTVAPDVTRLNNISLNNTFFGVGLSYPFGS